MIEKTSSYINLINEFILLRFRQLKKCNGLVFKDVFKSFNGGTFKSSNYVEKSKYKLITIKNINANGFDSSDATYINYDESYQKFLLKKGEILLTMTGAYLGRSGIVSEDNCFLNQRVLKITSESSAFLYCFLKENQENIFSLGKGSAQQNLSLQDLNVLPVNYTKDQIEDFKSNDVLIDYLVELNIKINKLKDIKNKYLDYFFR